MSINLENVKLDESLASDLRDNTQREPYKFEDFNLEGRVKIALKLLRPDNDSHKLAKEHMEYFLKNRRFDDVDEVPTILIDAIFGDRESLLRNTHKEKMAFETISDLTISQKKVLLGLCDHDVDPMIEIQKPENSMHRLFKMLDKMSLGKDYDLLKGVTLSKSVTPTQIHRASGAVSKLKRSEGL